MNAGPGSNPAGNIHPVVLVGGRSRRFGRDKLLEPWGDGAALVARPITALREVFGARVHTVGDCDARVAGLADGHIADLAPGAGPAGGIAAALRALGAPVLVVAGDMPDVLPADVARLAEGAAAAPEAWAVLAWTRGLEPCFGVYRPAALPALEAVVERSWPLRTAIPPEHLGVVPVRPGAVRNINTPADAEPRQR